ncbi:MAG TPA: alanine racemase [Dehalococcoidia bacterium]|nr:alanine racemase [Dehalococcoidia bacterium]
MALHPHGRPLWAEIDLAALAHNVRALKALAGSARLAAVVKANAYGHGAVPIARAAVAAGADLLAVICVEEGEQLRQGGIAVPVLVLGHSYPGDAERIVGQRLTPIVTTLELAEALSREAQGAGIQQPLHIKVDTGLNRYGLQPAEAVALAQRLREMPSLTVEGICTHFAEADAADKTHAREQFRLFMSVAEHLPWIPIRHVSNTAALLSLPEFNLEMVRPGIGLYGCSPSEDVSGPELRPVLSLKGRIVRLHRIESGDSVSYGRTWRAQRPSTIALVACGYGDGLPRALSNRGQMLVRGQRVPIVGRVCMDMSMLDVTEVRGVSEGDEVVMIGRQESESIPVEEIASLCGTISYEILCRIAARVERVYTGSNQDHRSALATNAGVSAARRSGREPAG